MLLAVVLQAEAKCFQDSAVVSANSLDFTISLRITTFAQIEKTCEGAIDDPDTVAELHYDDGGGEQLISQPFVFKGIGDYSITFDLRNDAIKFKAIQAQKLLYYVIKLRGDQPNKGSVQSIQHTQMNATNCWDDIKLYYNRVSGSEMISFYGDPLNCAINSPQIIFYYYAGEQWVSFEVVGSASYNSQSNVYYKNMPFYNFNAINYYAQERKDLPEADKALFDGFFSNFSADRNIYCRLQIISDVTATYQQVVLGQISVFIASGTLCLEQMTPRTYITPKYVALAAELQHYPEIADCPSTAARFQVQILLDFGSFVFLTPVLSNVYEEFINRNGMMHYFLKEWENPYDHASVYYAAYLTAFDASDNVVMEASHRGAAHITCILDKVYSLRKQQGCIDILMSNQDKCRYEGTKKYHLLLMTQEHGYTSRKTFLSYEFDIPHVAEITRFCTARESQEYLGHKADGSMAERFKSYSKAVARHSQLAVFLKEEDEYIVDSFVQLEDETLTLISFFAMFAVIFVVSAGAAGYLIVYDFKAKG